MDVDPEAGVAAPGGAGAELQTAAIQLHGVIVLDSPLVLETADVLQVGRRGSPGRIWVRGGQREARVVAREKPVQDALGLGEGPGLGQAQLDDEAILEGAKEAFDAAFGLRRTGGNPANAQLLEGAADLGGLGPACELLDHTERSAGIAVKDPMAIGIGGTGTAIAADELPEEEKIAVRVFLEAKDAREDGASGVVDGRM